LPPILVTKTSCVIFWRTASYSHRYPPSALPLLLLPPLSSLLSPLFSFFSWEEGGGRGKRKRKDKGGMRKEEGGRRKEEGGGRREERVPVTVVCNPPKNNAGCLYQKIGGKVEAPSSPLLTPLLTPQAICPRQYGQHGSPSCHPPSCPPLFVKI
jgi:hypothetical protein